jgi:hypothetical protein
MALFPTVLLALALSAPSGAPDGVVWRPGFGRAPLWNDGMAEVSLYEATDVKYGVPRASRAALIVVAEDLGKESLVKPDRAAGESATIRVLKLNHVRSIPTGAYIYQQMLSVFAGADRLDPVKLTMTSHEWCGNSFAEWRADRATLSIRSYFEEPGDVDVPLSPAGALFYDALPLVLRGLDFGRTRAGAVRVIDSVFGARPLAPATVTADLEVIPPAKLSGVYRVVLRRGARRDSLDFETGFPHRLTRWDRSDGGTMRLTTSRRYRYWEKNAPGDERLLSAPAAR